MFKWTLIGFSCLYFLIAGLLFLQEGFLGIPNEALSNLGENFFLPFSLVQIGLLYLISSSITSETIQLRLMLVLFPVVKN